MTALLATRVLQADAASVADAARVLAAGGLVAFPTETVYGLGADATDGRAIARLYDAKGRPAFNPLIAHVVDGRPRTLARLDGDAGPARRSLLAGTAHPRPGPRRRVSGATSWRRPASTPWRSVCRPIPSPAPCSNRREAPIAAPSANRAPWLSPTLAAHVRADLDGRIDLLLDGGPTPGGVESTIVACLGEPDPAAAGRRAAGGDRANASATTRRRGGRSVQR